MDQKSHLQFHLKIIYQYRISLLPIKKANKCKEIIIRRFAIKQHSDKIRQSNHAKIQQIRAQRGSTATKINFTQKVQIHFAKR